MLISLVPDLVVGGEPDAVAGIRAAAVPAEEILTGRNAQCVARDASMGHQ